MLIMRAINHDSLFLICILHVSFSCLFFPPGFPHILDYLFICKLFFRPLKIGVFQGTLCVSALNPLIHLIFRCSPQPQNFKHCKMEPLIFTPSLFNSQFSQHTYGTTQVKNQCVFLTFFFPYLQSIVNPDYLIGNIYLRLCLYSFFSICRQEPDCICLCSLNH